MPSKENSKLSYDCFLPSCNIKKNGVEIFGIFLKGWENSILIKSNDLVIAVVGIYALM